MWRKARIAAGTLFTTLLIAGLVVLVSHSLYTQPGPLQAETTVIVPKGASAQDIAKALDGADVISSPLGFRAAARLTSASALQAGEYRFSPHLSMRDVLRMLREGDTVTHHITIPEGMTSRQVVALLNDADGLAGDVVAPPVEGALLPATYDYVLGDSRNQLIQRMSAGMTAVLNDLWDARAADLPLNSPREAVILASIVEKETAVPEERPHVAAVFLNRLRLGMRLQADPTVAYAVHGSSGQAPLRLSDLQYPSPYNTYFALGLPPGPIANPGRASLAAVLQPMQTEDLYFVADGTGGHAFARTLDEHNRNVTRWRRLSAGIPGE